MCESVSCSACDLDGFGILVFGPQTRNLHPGGSGRGGLESGGWQCRGPEGGGTAGGGVRMGCPSLSLLFVFCSPSPSLCMCSAAPAVGLPTLSQGHTGRSLRTTSVRQLSREDRSQWEDTLVRDRRPIRQKIYL